MANIYQNESQSVVECDLEVTFISLYALIKKQVAVYCSVLPQKRDGFHTCICISGELQYSRDRDSWRVLVNEGTYSYFQTNDVDYICEHPEKFRDGNKACIGLKIESE